MWKDIKYINISFLYPFFPFLLCLFFFISRFLDEKKKRHLRRLVVLFCFVEFEVFPL